MWRRHGVRARAPVRSQPTIGSVTLEGMPGRVVAVAAEPLPRRFGAAFALARPALYVVGLMTLSVAIRFAAARAAVAPSIFPDELVYTDLARGFARNGTFSVGGEPFAPWSYGVLYPLILSPVFFFVRNMESAYTLVKLVNCVLVSSAAIPAYLMARRLLSSRQSVLFAAIALALPSLVYSSHVMTESLAYPVFLWAALSIQRVIDLPSARRQCAALAVIAVATGARAQMIVLVPALVTAILAVAIVGGADDARSRAAWREFRLTWLALAVGFGVAAVAAIVAPQTVLGGHIAQARHVDVLSVPGWVIAYIGELDFASGVIPFGAFLLLALAVRQLSRAASVFVVTTGALSVWFIVLGATFTTQQQLRPPIYERYDFYLTSLLLLALFVWINERQPWSRAGRLCVLLTAALPLAVPYGDLLVSRGWGVNTSTVGLVPAALLRLGFHSLVPVYGVTAATAIGFSALLATRRSRTGYGIVAPAVAYLLAVGLVVHAANVAVALRAHRLGVGGADRSWVDRVVGEAAQVPVIWSGTTTSGWRSGYAIWESEFYNRSVTTVYTIRGGFQGQQGGGRLTLRNGLATFGGKPIAPKYVLADPKTVVAGAVLARDAATGLTLYRVRGPLRLRLRIS